MMMESGGGTATLAFDQIHLLAPSTKSSGKIKLAAAGLGWKESATSQVTTLEAKDFAEMTWIRSCRGYQLRVHSKDGRTTIFDGFTQDNYESLAAFCAKYYEGAAEDGSRFSLIRVEASLRGGNWGELCIDEERREVRFELPANPIFSIRTDDVANVTVTGNTKDELAIEFVQPVQTDARVDSLMEMRFHVPGNDEEEDEEVDQEVDEDGDVKMTSERKPEISKAAILCDQLRAVSSQVSAVSETDIIATLPELASLVPRGRFTVDLGTDCMRLRGKSVDYRIAYGGITRAFLLPKADDIHIVLVLALDPPLRQGMTRYPFLLLHFDKDEVFDLQLKNVGETDEEVSKRFQGRLQHRSWTAPIFEQMSTLLRVLGGLRLVVPGEFKSAAGVACVKCSVKASEGFLYVLDRFLLFVPKPVVLLTLADIETVQFSRVGSSRSFDIKIMLRSGAAVHTFSNLQTEEYPLLEEFLRAKGVECVRDPADVAAESAAKSAAGMYAESSDDSDFVDEEDDDDESDDDEEDDE